MSELDTSTKLSSLDWTKFSYDEVISDLSSILNLQDSQVMDFYSSSTGRMLLEMFAAIQEMNHLGVESGIKESYITTLQKRSSAYVSAASYGYSVRRPTPARCSFRVELDGSVGSAYGTITIPRFTTFSAAGTQFITEKEYTFKWDKDGNVTCDDTPTLIEGTIKTSKFEADGTKLFQKFYISDSTFSDYFGDGDSLDDSINSLKLTRVRVGDDYGIDSNGDIVYNESQYWNIDRKTLYSNDKTTNPSYENGSLNLSTNKKVLIRTVADGSVELSFGDGIISEIPSGEIQVDYLSTSGKNGNQYSVKGLESSLMSTSGIDFSPKNSLTLDNLKFFITSDILGGDDVEAINSIIYNSPKIFYSLDRACTTDDYNAILQTMPNVKHSIAYGEDKLGAGDYRYFNVVMYTVLKNLYIDESDTYRIATPSEYIMSGFTTLNVAQGFQDAAGYPSYRYSYLEKNFDIADDDNDVGVQSKYQTYVDTLGEIFRLTDQNIEESSEIGYIQTQLNKKGLATVKHMYFPAKVHKFKMQSTVYVSPMSSKNTLKTNIQQKSYAYLSENTKFDFPVYQSKIIKLIEAMKGIVGCHVTFTPTDEKANDSTDISIYFENSIDILNDLLSSLQKIVEYNSTISSLFDDVLGDPEFYTLLLDEYFGYNDANITLKPEIITEANVQKIIAYVWKKTLNRLILNPNFMSGNIANIADMFVSNYQKSIANGGLLNYELDTEVGEHIYDTFIRWAVSLRKETNYYTSYNLINNKGDISEYSLPCEIAQVEIDTDDIDIITKTTN